MGILGRLFGGGAQANESERMLERMRAEPLAKAVGGYLGEELKFSGLSKHTGYHSKSGIIGVYAVALYDIKPEDEAELPALPEKEGVVGFRSGTMVRKEFLQPILDGLRADGIPFKLYVPRRRTVPAAIVTDKGNIYIAPYIETR